MKAMHSKRAWEVLGSLAIVAVFSLPFVSGAKSGHTYFVNDNASGVQDGSSAHPYQHIYQATNKAKDGDKINVASGTYKENVTVPTGVTLNGSGRGDVTIKADDDDAAVVTLKHKSKLWNVTVKDGKIGVIVKKDAVAEIVDSRIIENRHEGVAALTAERSDKGLLSIVNTEIYDNGWSGVYSQKRKLVIIESDIKDNHRNGVVMEAGVKAWIDNNSISGNKENGIFAKLDGASITVASKNTLRHNGNDGVLVQSNGGSGYILIKKSRLSENVAYGVAKVQKGAVAASVWNGLHVENNNTFFGNGKGTISPVVKQ